MRIAEKISLLSISVLLTCSQAKADTPAASPSSNAVKNSSSSSSSSSASFPKKALGFLLGSVVGVPVCAVRKPIDEVKFGSEQLACGSDQPRVKIPATILYFPFGVISGVLESPMSSLKHSWQNIDDPFSKEQFSLKEKPEPKEKEPIYGNDSQR